MLMTQFRATTCAIVGTAMLSADAGVAVDAQSIDVELSTLTVHVYKTGLFSAFADNHIIRAPIAGGRISEEGTRAVELTLKAAQMTVLDPGCRLTNAPRSRRACAVPRHSTANAIPTSASSRRALLRKAPTVGKSPATSGYTAPHVR